MGVEEELEALRKQGVTTKNANELKDAEGLNTPEGAENAIKAEHERNRLANYGKEAGDILKAGTPRSDYLNTMSTFENDDLESPPATTEDEAAAKTTEAEAPAAKQSKDITDMIQITNDFAFVDNTIVDAGDDGGENPMDCLLKPPTFCPIDAESVDGATRSVRGAFDEHVVPKIDGASRSIRVAYDEHLVPGVEKIRQQSMETVGDIQRKSVETFDAAKTHSIRGIESAKEGTQKIFGEVKKNTDRGAEAVRMHTQLFMEKSKAAADDVSAKTKAAVAGVSVTTKAAVDGVSAKTKAAVEGVSTKTTEIVNEKVKPGFKNLVETSQKTVHSTTEKCQTAFSALVEAITVTYAPFYLGTAPGWASITTNSTDPDYWLWKEACLRAFGRVVFCDNPVTGLLIWIGILCSSPLAAWCSLLGVLTVS